MGAAFHQKGFNLIEILVALCVLSIGMLGVASMQIGGVRAAQGSYFRSQATAAMTDIVERMYANLPAVRAGQYGAVDSDGMACGALPACGPGGAACTSATLAQYDIQQVACGTPGADGPTGPMDGVRRALPLGRLQITCVDAAGATAAACVVNSRHRITVSWSERGLNNDSAQGELAVQQVTTLVQP